MSPHMGLLITLAEHLRLPGWRTKSIKSTLSLRLLLCMSQPVACLESSPLRKFHTLWHQVCHLPRPALPPLTPALSFCLSAAFRRKTSKKPQPCTNPSTRLGQACGTRELARPYNSAPSHCSGCASSQLVACPTCNHNYAWLPCMNSSSRSRWLFSVTRISIVWAWNRPCVLLVR